MSVKKAVLVALICVLPFGLFAVIGYFLGRCMVRWLRKEEQEQVNGRTYIRTLLEDGKDNKLSWRQEDEMQLIWSRLSYIREEKEKPAKLTAIPTLKRKKSA